MCLNISHCLLLATSGRGFLGSHMTAEGARWGEFAQSMADHVFGDVDRNMSASIMHCDGVTHHLREDHAGTTPCPQHFLLTFLVHGFYSLEKLGLDKRALFQ